MTMEVRLLTRTPDDFVVGLCIIDPGREGVGNRTFSLTMDVAGWVEYLWNLIHAVAIRVIVFNEALLYA